MIRIIIYHKWWFFTAALYTYGSSCKKIAVHKPLLKVDSSFINDTRFHIFSFLQAFPESTKQVDAFYSSKVWTKRKWTENHLAWSLPFAWWCCSPQTAMVNHSESRSRRIATCCWPGRWTLSHRIRMHGPRQNT